MASTRTRTTSDEHLSHQYQTDKPWLDLQHNDNGTVIKPEELEKQMKDPPNRFNPQAFDRIHGSMIGMALGDALGAHVEFRPHEFMINNPVTDLQGGGTWGLKKGQFTDDTSMALCLANSLIIRKDYDPYDQLVRYKWWFRHGYMSSTGKCFDIGSATKHSIVEFEARQKKFAIKYQIPSDELDFISDLDVLDQFDVKCSDEGVAGNGALMRLAPVPLFFFKLPLYAVEYSGHSGEITHGDMKAYDACRYYGALIVAAVNGAKREDLLSEDFYKKHKPWFGSKPLHADIEAIARGSYKKEKGYEAGIRGKGYIVAALEAALWAFWSDEDSFEKGVLAAINLGDDTDTTAAIYGQLAGAYYGYKKLPEKWVEQVYASKFIECLSKWITYEGERWSPNKLAPATTPSLNAPDDDARTRRRSSVSNDPHSIPTDLGTRSRGSSFVETGSIAKPPILEDSSQLYRVKSVEIKQLESQPQRIYKHKTVSSTDDVAKWLKSLGDDYISYVEVFKIKGVDGYWLLNMIDDRILLEYGIKCKEHREGICQGIEELRQKCPKMYSIVQKH